MKNSKTWRFWFRYYDVLFKNLTRKKRVLVSEALEGGLIFHRSLTWDEVLQPACRCFELKVTGFHLALVVVMDLELRLPAWILIPNNGKGLSLKGTRKKSVQLGMNWLSQCCDCMFCCGFCVKNDSTWLTVLPAPCFQVRLEVFLSFLHTKVRRKRLVYFIVSNHSVLNLYFIKWLGLNLRRTAFELLVTFFTFKDIDTCSMFWWLFCTFRNSTCLQLFNVTIARLSNTSFGFLPC